VVLMPNGHPHKPRRLSKLGNALGKRIGRLGNPIDTDIENMILSHQKVVDLTPDSHPDKPALLSSLFSELQTRFHYLKNLTDLENAILSKQKVVDLSHTRWSPKQAILSFRPRECA